MLLLCHYYVIKSNAFVFNKLGYEIGMSKSRSAGIGG